MTHVDFSYITPRYLEHLQSSILWQTAEQYRYAADLLRRNPVNMGGELRTELLRAVQMLEDEMERRMHVEAAGAISDTCRDDTGVILPTP